MHSPEEREEFRRFVGEQKWFHSDRFRPRGLERPISKGPASEQHAVCDDGVSLRDGSGGCAHPRYRHDGRADCLRLDQAGRLGRRHRFHRHVTFERAAKELELDVDYRPGLQIKDLVATFGHGAFDVIVCSGVIYHMLNPFSAFGEARKLVKEGGYVIFEFAARADSDDAGLHLNSETAKSLHELYTYWVPTPAALVGLAKLCSFNPIATRLLRSPQRYTVLAQAVHPSDVAGRSALLQRIHEVDFCDFEFQLKSVLINKERSTVALSST